MKIGIVQKLSVKVFHIKCQQNLQKGSLNTRCSIFMVQASLQHRLFLITKSNRNSIISFSCDFNKSIRYMKRSYDYGCIVKHTRVVGLDWIYQYVQEWTLMHLRYQNTKHLFSRIITR
jgi:hypothetical protein